jgi:hypothetical protein
MQAKKDLQEISLGSIEFKSLSAPGLLSTLSLWLEYEKRLTGKHLLKTTKTKAHHIELKGVTSHFEAESKPNVTKERLSTFTSSVSSNSTQWSRETPTLLKSACTLDLQSSHSRFSTRDQDTCSTGHNSSWQSALSWSFSYPSD